jgi:hypothetical protein
LIIPLTQPFLKNALKSSPIHFDRQIILSLLNIFELQCDQNNRNSRYRLLKLKFKIGFRLDGRRVDNKNHRIGGIHLTRSVTTVICKFLLTFREAGHFPLLNSIEKPATFQIPTASKYKTSNMVMIMKAISDLSNNSFSFVLQMGRSAI